MFKSWWPPSKQKCILCNYSTIIKQGLRIKNTQTIKATQIQWVHVKRGNRDESCESRGQASGGSLVLCCRRMYNSDWPSPFLSSSHVNEPRHSIWGEGWGEGGGGQEKKRERGRCMRVKNMETRRREEEWDATGGRRGRRWGESGEQVPEADEQSWEKQESVVCRMCSSRKEKEKLVRFPSCSSHCMTISQHKIQARWNGPLFCTLKEPLKKYHSYFSQIPWDNSSISLFRQQLRLRCEWGVHVCMFTFCICAYTVCVCMVLGTVKTQELHLHIQWFIVSTGGRKTSSAHRIIEDLKLFNTITYEIKRKWLIGLKMTHLIDEIWEGTASPGSSSEEEEEEEREETRRKH